MPRYYCDYCDMYLTHDSAIGRKQHNYGWKHRENYKVFYANILQKQRAAGLMPLPGAPGAPQMALPTLPSALPPAPSQENLPPAPPAAATSMPMPDFMTGFLQQRQLGGAPSGSVSIPPPPPSLPVAGAPPPVVPGIAHQPPPQSEVTPAPESVAVQSDPSVAQPSLS